MPIPPSPRTAVTTWAGWLLGFATLAALVVGVSHLTEEREIAALMGRIEPAWLGLALVLQAGTYAAQGEIWRRVLRAGGHAIPLGEAFRLSLAKLFMDQAIPSAGISGSIVVGQALERRGVPRPTVMASVVVNTISLYTCNVVSLAPALVIVALRGRLSRTLLAGAVLFLLFVVALLIVLLRLARRHEVPGWAALRGTRLQKALALFAEARSDLVGDPSLRVQATLLQGAIVLLDVATVWGLLRGLGAAASPEGVFASFVVATLVRMLAPIPGGLGVFEAASVGTLSLTGVPLSAALAGTLLFRGLSFWLPMIPGLWLSRRATRAAASSI